MRVETLEPSSPEASSWLRGPETSGAGIRGDPGKKVLGARGSGIRLFWG